MRKALWAVLTTAAFFALLELSLFLLQVAPPASAQPLVAELDARGRGVRVQQEDASEMARTVIYNVSQNPVMSPDLDLIFRVRRNPDGERIAGFAGINALGFRGDRIDQAAPERSIMVLGDSCVFGWGAEELDATFPYLLQRALEEDGLRYQVYNLGQPGHSTTQGLRLYQEWVSRVRPEFVVLYFGWNDIWPTPLLTDAQTIRMLKLRNNWALRAITGSRTYGLMSRALEAAHVLPEQGADTAGTEDAEYRPRVPPDEVVRNYSTMSGDATTLIILPPFINLTDRVATRMREYRRLVEETMANDAIVIRLDAMEADASNAGALFIQDGFHPNERGNRYIAGRLRDIITLEAGRSVSR